MAVAPNTGGPEWRKWCSDEGPPKPFAKWQRVLRQRARERLIDREATDG